MSKVLLSSNVEIEIPFHDCDPMKIVWHGNYARYFEVARCELLRKIDYDYQQMADSGYSWPIVDMRLKYIASAHFFDKILVTAELIEYEMRLKINYLITCLATGKKLTKGYTVQVAVELASGDMLFNSPKILLDKLNGYLDE